MWGEENRQGHSCTSTNVLRQPDDSWIRLTEPINIGSEEMVTINQLVDIGRDCWKEDNQRHVDALGVRGRNSNNDLIREKLGWDYEMTLEEGMKKTYEWVRWQVSKQIYSVV